MEASEAIVAAADAEVVMAEEIVAARSTEVSHYSLSSRSLFCPVAPSGTRCCLPYKSDSVEGGRNVANNHFQDTGQYLH